MKINMGKYDVIIRMAVGAVAVVGGLFMALGQGDAIGFAIAAPGAVLFATSIIRWCPVYAFLGLSSCTTPECRAEHAGRR